MPNIIGKIVGYSKGVIDSLDEKYNFKQPEVVSFSVNGKKEKDSKLEITEKNTRWYIGQMFHHKESIYSKDFILGSLGYLFRKRKKGEKVVIEIASSVGQILNPSESQRGTMSFTSQKEYIENLASHYHKKGAKDLKVVNLEDKHPELFQELREKGISGLNTEKDIILDKDNFNSLDIAKLLYKAVQNNKRLFKRISSTRPGKLKGPEDYIEDSNFYGLIEIALRITDFLNGVTNQGGEKRQTRYDKIILDIINGNLDKIPQIKQLSEFVNHSKGEREFSAIYFDSKKHLELKEKTSEKKKTNKVIMTTSAAILAVLIGFGSSEMIDKKNRKDNIGKAIDIILKDKEMVARYNFMVSSFKTLEQKKEFLNGAVDNIFGLFTKRYNTGNLSEDDLKYTILSELCRGENINYMLNIDNLLNNAYNFIEKILIPNNRIFFLQHGVDINPYGKLKSYMRNFGKTYYMPNSDMVNLNKDIQDLKLSFQYLGEYTTQSGYEYYIAITGPSGNNNEYSPYTGYLVARNIFSDKIYNASDSKIVARDFLQNIYVRQITEELIDTFYTIYGKTFIDNKLKYAISREFLISQGNKAIESPIKWNFKKRVEFLENSFIKHNKKLLEDNNIDTSPYKRYQKFQEIFQNTIDIPLEILKKVTINDLEYIGAYQYNDDEKYNIYKFKYNGKNYIIGCPNNIYPHNLNSYYINIGKKIAKHFLDQNYSKKQ